MKLREAIPDTGLRVGALGRLLETDHVDEATLDAALTPAVTKILAEADYWTEEDGERKPDLDYDEDMLQHGLDALAELELGTEALASVTGLDFDGGNEIYMWFEQRLAERLGLEGWELDTGGESELYVVSSFAGLERLTGLETLDLDAYGWSDKARDAAPFASLTGLRELNLMGAKLDGAEALLGLPALTKVRGAGGLPAGVREALAGKGVTVD